MSGALVVKKNRIILITRNLETVKEEIRLILDLRNQMKHAGFNGLNSGQKIIPAETQRRGGYSPLGSSVSAGEIENYEITIFFNKKRGTI